MDAEVARLSRARKAFQDRGFAVRLDLARLPDRIRELAETAPLIGADLMRRIDTSGDRFHIEIAGREYAVRADAAARLRRILVDETTTSLVRRLIQIGRFAGFDLEACVHRGFPSELSGFHSARQLLECLQVAHGRGLCELNRCGVLVLTTEDKSEGGTERSTPEAAAQRTRNPEPRNLRGAERARSRAGPPA